MVLPPTPSAADLLRTYKLPALRRFAQNFLLDPRATSKFVACAGNIENKFVVEVGPGPGGITKQLFEHGAARTLSNAVDSRLRLYLGDILDFNIESVLPDDITTQRGSWESDESSSCSPIHLLGNLPFNIAIPLLIRWLKQVSTRSGPFSFGYRIPITICMQEAVAGRIVSDALMDQRGRLSIIFQNWFDCRVKHVFSGRAFVPAANVNVAVIQLIPLKRPLVEVSYDLLDKVTRVAFHTRNKKMGTTMGALFQEETRDDDTRELLHRAHLKSDTMCLTLAAEEFGHLAQIYGDIISRPRPIHEQLDRKINQNELTFELGETYVRPEKIKTKKKSKKDWDE
ncbi:unnamed protein product [Rotaria magnacalcarata]|uniref:rRNA adenine N(6)-methyltransferase n=2 Tax=Rotaria magnacalcarata TaxID=392030 RepID=A0A819EPX0_9BILA|nr:unnamed protein product [Rotaria magnacalcarata]CAF3867041.1 unnamed protein product [Rotaria magnacalcarata]CAF4039598.1 unnamed protein product [Rotaria magnacalcarata]